LFGVGVLWGAQGCGLAADDETPANLGAQCMPSAEWRIDYSGAAVSEVGIEPGSPFCTDSGSVCLTNHFQGRVSCPYGQDAPSTSVVVGSLEEGNEEMVTHTEHCSVPDSPGDLIQVPVKPQLQARTPDKAVYCSCRCAGPDPDADYCECGSGYTCQGLIDDLGFNSSTAGAYCVKNGTAISNPTTIPQTPCNYDDKDCGDQVTVSVSGVGEVQPQTPSASFVDRINVSGPAKLDLLLVVDNSPGMLDKQRLFSESLPRLLQGLSSPPCADAAGAIVASSSSQGCPEGSAPKYPSIKDINVGVISSSLGGFGSTSGVCSNSAESDQKEDMGHLLGSLPRGQAAVQGNAALDATGFLGWRGEGDAAAFSSALQSLVQSAGDAGCGYEATLESFYRFLVDPEPYLSLAQVSCAAGGTDINCRAPEGIDQTVLDQRAAFLRPDSLVAVMVLSDENDCSVKASGQAWFVAQDGPNSPMWRPSAICETDPNNACCYSCGQTPPANCAADPICGDPNNTRETTDFYLNDAGERDTLVDPSALRCFHQKQRFGVDFLYPVQRYSNALAQRELCVTRNDLSAANCGSGRIIDNPLYTIPENATVTLTRDSNMVFFSAVVGVPWQDIARDPSDAVALSYKTLAELEVDQVWPLILGDGVSPGDPLMQESIAPRMGTNPVIIAPLAPPDSIDAWTNPINGHEWTNTLRDGLQPACAYPFATPLDCTTALPGTCDCIGVDVEQDNRAQCQAPDGSYGATQYAAVAYPGIRQLQVAKDYGAMTGNSVVGSICPRNISDATADDYGYYPAMDALVSTLAEGNGPRCLPRPLPVAVTGETQCLMVSVDPSGNDCDCGRVGREELPAGTSRAWIDTALQQNGVCSGANCSSLCACVIPQLEGAERQDCENNTVVSSGDGWCYIDATVGVDIGSPDLVNRCPVTAKRMLRFVGEGSPESGSTTFINCSN
jgi:hypothetical protein